MVPSGIDWHRTALLAVVALVGLLGLVIAWKVTKLLFKLGVLLVLLGVVAALGFWWKSAH